MHPQNRTQGVNADTNEWQAGYNLGHLDGWSWGTIVGMLVTAASAAVVYLDWLGEFWLLIPLLGGSALILARPAVCKLHSDIRMAERNTRRRQQQ